ncbi:MAG: hypothetical protein ABI132_00815 [Rhodanobacteraceae bacterium]
MRTTLAIDDDVLAMARALAQQQRKSLGEVVSELARKSLTPEEPVPKFRNGIRLLPVRPGAKPVTLEMVNKLRDELDRLP